MKRIFNFKFFKKTIYLVLFFLLLWWAGKVGWKVHEIAEDKGCTQFKEDVYPLPAYNQEKLSIVVLGDAGTGTQTQIKVATAIEKHCKVADCDFALYLGDNFYPNGLASQQDPLFRTHFQEIYQKITLPFYAILGNHDVRGKAQVQVYHGLTDKKWRMPNYNYRLQAGPAEIFALNSSCPTVAVDWLDGALESSKAKWKIVMAHHTLYSSGAHGDGPKLARIWWEGNAADKVDIYLSGHDHQLEHLQKGRNHYLISGAAGLPTRPERKQNASDAKSLFKTLKAGFLKVDLEPGQIQFTFYDDNAVQLYSSTIKK